MFFIEKRYSNDSTNRRIPNRVCLEAMLNSAGFEIIAYPEAEVFIYRRGEVAGEPRPVCPVKARDEE